MHRDVDRILIDRLAIARQVASTAGSIAADLYQDDGETVNLQARHAPITLVPILTGSFIFAADLIRHLPVRMQIRLISVSSYPGASIRSRGARIRQGMTDLPATLRGHRVLIVDDVLDSGRTLKLVQELIRQRQPDSVCTCVLLRKAGRAPADVQVDYVCFDIPDLFVVGYGLDFGDYYRNLPDIVTLRPDIIDQRRDG